MREVVQLLRTALPPEQQPKGIIVGGAAINEQAREQIGADYCATDAMDGVRLCQQLMEQAGP
jgi:methanogenic corrinoid protein MtbC1